MFEQNTLAISPQTTYFKQYYKAFRRQIRKEAGGDTSNRVIIKLDIENYFDEISIPILLRFLNAYIKPSDQAALHFDATTQEQLKSFFGFLSDGRRGIPQADNDVISSFIGYLYMVFGDLLLDDLLRQEPFASGLKRYQIIRYVDDINLAIDFNDELDQSSREKVVGAIASHVADMFYYQLGLRFNAKTRLFWLSDDEDRKAFLASVKRVSPEYYVEDDDNDETPQNKIANILQELQELKASRVDGSLRQDASLQEEVLKEVYDERVDQMLKMQANQDELAVIFDGFNFELVKARPLEIIIIILKHKATADRFRLFLLDKQYLTTGDVDLILRFLSQIRFEDADLLSKLGQNQYMEAVMGAFRRADLSYDIPGYYELPDLKVRSLSTLPHVIEQIRLRILNERQHNYSVALNHLLNEIHAIAFQRDPSSKGNGNEYNANDVVKFLAAQNTPNDTCIKIRNLFDRRNTNQVSHPGTDSVIAWGVDENEYIEYRTHVGKGLAHII